MALFLTRFRLSILRIPLAVPFVTALRRVDAATAIRLELVERDGTVGVGEAPPTPAITGETLESIADTIRTRLLPNLLERPLSEAEAFARLHSEALAPPSARACVDIALHNLLARQQKTPLWRRLGGEKAPRRRTAVTVSLATPKVMARQAADHLCQGRTLLKIKLGGPVDQDLARLRAIRQTAPTAPLLADANQAWNEAETRHFLDAAAPLDLELVEQPLPADNLEGMRRITAQSPIPILADESAFDAEGVRTVLEKRAAHLINVKLMKCGGITPALSILRQCEEAGIGCMMGSMLETPGSIAAALHLTACFPRTLRYIDLDSPLLYAHCPADAPILWQQDTLSVRDFSTPISPRSSRCDTLSSS